MTEDVGEVFAVVAEFGNQGPIVMEQEGPGTSRGAARARMNEMLGRRDCLRACVVRLVYETGNELLIHDLKRMQK